MTDSFVMLLTNALLACAAAGTLCLLATVVAVRHFARRNTPSGGDRPPVSVLKPLCGDEPALYENLRSFCRQRYAACQLVFGVQNPRDPAILVVERLRAEFPRLEIELVISPERPAGGNGKVANLAGMLPTARHAILVMADADIRVGPDYLAKLVAALQEPNVGLVTCLYRGRPAGGFWSRLAALHIDQGFLPQALLGDAVGIGDGCFGATIAMHRATLEAAGGFSAIVGRLADDHALGEAVRALGKRVYLAPFLVDHVVSETNPGDLLVRERRWALTIRSLAPTGFLGTFVTHPLAFAVLANILSECRASAAAMLICTVICRFASAWATNALLGTPSSSLWLLPLRDGLSFWVFVTSFLTRTVAWRGQRLRVTRRGLIHGGR